MKNAPLISVVIPVFNLEAHIGAAIDSVLGQSFRDLEIIVVDDGSTDRSRAIIERYQQQESDRLRTIFRKHAGAAAARNAGIDIVRGDWIAFLDGDDLWKPSKLETQLEEIGKDPQTNLSSTAAEIFGQSSLLLKTVPEGQNIKLELLRKGCFITLSSVLILKEFLGSTRFDEGLLGAQDLDLYLRLPDTVHYRFIPKPLISYRIREGSISDPQTTRYAQLNCHYQIVKREVKKLESADPVSYRRLAKELHAKIALLSHEATYYSLKSRLSSWPDRVKLAWAAIREDPSRIKNYRFLLQSLLPRKLNRKSEVLRKT